MQTWHCWGWIMNFLSYTLLKYSLMVDHLGRNFDNGNLQPWKRFLATPVAWSESKIQKGFGSSVLIGWRDDFLPKIRTNQEPQFVVLFGRLCWFFGTADLFNLPLWFSHFVKKRGLDIFREIFYQCKSRSRFADGRLSGAHQSYINTTSKSKMQHWIW